VTPEAEHAKARAGAAIELRRPAEARSILEQVLARDPSDAEALLLLARACTDEQDFARAHLLTRSASAAAPDDLDILVGCADVARESYDLEAAHFWASRALEIAPDSTAALNVMSLVQMQRGQGSDALVYAEEALRHRPLDPDLLVAQGLALDTAGRLGDATAYYIQALELDPQHLPGLNNLATVRLQCGDLRRASSLFGRALLLDPRFGIARENLDQVGLLARRVLLGRVGVGVCLAGLAAYLRWPWFWVIAVVTVVWVLVDAVRLPAPARSRLGAALGWPDLLIGALVFFSLPVGLGLAESGRRPPTAFAWIAVFALTLIGRLGWNRLRVARRLRQLGLRLPPA